MHCYQMDTLEQSDNAKEDAQNYDVMPPYYLVLININSRKGFAYPMNTKSAPDVAAAITNFLKDVPITHLYTDADRAYTGVEVQTLLNQYKVQHHTTTNDNKHALGIVNRFIKTIRDWNGAERRDIDLGDMLQLLDEYNDTVHSATKCKPNDWTKAKNDAYVEQKHREMIAKQGGDDIHIGDMVRIPRNYSMFAKRRIQYEPDLYKVEGIDGNRFQVLKNGKLVTFSRFQLRKPFGGERQHQTGPDGDAIAKILEYDAETREYLVECEDGSQTTVTARSLRDKSNRLSLLERKFWHSKPGTKIPNAIKKLLPFYINKLNDQART